MIKIDLSIEALLARRELAEKATPGPWLTNDRNTSTPFDISIKNGTCFCQIGWGTKRQDITHIAANDPPTVIATIDELLRLRGENARLKEALENLLRFAECQICYHESTHRGGSIWTICDDCGAKWADDEGGKPEFKEPNEIVNARKALAAAHRAVEEA